MLCLRVLCVCVFLFVCLFVCLLVCLFVYLFDCFGIGVYRPYLDSWSCRKAAGAWDSVVCVV